jgi:hypothetical protein
MERVCDEIKSILLEHAEEELTDITADYADIDAANFGESLSMPVPEPDSFLFDTLEIPNSAFPAIVFVPVEERPEGVGVVLALNIEVYIADVNDGRVPRLLRRYCKAISNILQRHERLDGKAKASEVKGIAYYPGRAKLPGGTFFRAGLVQIEVLKLNDGKRL